MMNILDRYLARHILVSTLMVLTIIVSLDAFFTLLHEGKYVSRYETYTYPQVFGYILLRMPGKIVEFLPAITLIGSLLGLGALGSNSELTAMRAAGMAKSAIVVSCMKTGLLLVLAMFALNEYVIPVSEVRASTFRAQGHGKQVTTDLKNYWARDGEQFVHIGQATSGDRLQQVQIFTIEGQRLMQRQQVREAQWLPDQQQWALSGIKQQDFMEEEILSETIYTANRDSLINADLLEVATVRPRDMSIRDLYEYASYLQDNKLDASAYLQAFWKKVAAPLSILVMMLLAMPFVFVNRRAGNAGARLVVGIMIGMAFYILSNLASDLGQVWGLSAFWGAMMPLFIASGIGVWVLRRSEA